MRETFVVQGFEFTQTEDLSHKLLTDDAVMILGFVKRFGVAVFKIDTGLTDEETLRQIKELSLDGHFTVFHNVDNKVYVICNDSRTSQFDVPMSHS